MTTNYHTPHTDGDLLDAVRLNTPLGELDAAIGARLSAPAAVTTNAAKLALTGISAGHMVRITGEAHRLEMYLGGAINIDANWQIIGPNTYKLYAYTGGVVDPWAINGVVVTATEADFATLVGWVREGEKLTITGQVTKNLETAWVQYIEDQHLYGHTPDTLPVTMEDGYSWLYLPYRFPDRCPSVVVGFTEAAE